MTAFLGSNRSIPLADAIARYGAERLREALATKRAVATGRPGLPSPNAPPAERVGISAAAWVGAEMLPDSCARLGDGWFAHDVVVLATGLEDAPQRERKPRRAGERQSAGDAAVAWMRANVGPDAPWKYEQAVASCVAATGCSRDAARSAWKKLPLSQRTPRGRPPKA